MRAKFILLAIAVQFLVLGWMAWQRESIMRTGPTVWLRTAPVDPRDLFRGDFVRLGYEITGLPKSMFGPALAAELADRAKVTDHRTRRRGKELVIYTALAVDPESGSAKAIGVDLAPPADGLFIKGRVEANSYSPIDFLANIAYGIDAYFVEQGTGYALERRAPQGTPDGFQVPMEMQVALGRDGTAVIVNHRWAPLGIQMEFENSNRTTAYPGGIRDEDDTSPLGKIRVGLCNADAVPRAVVLPKDLRTLRIDRVEGWNGTGKRVSPPRAGLAPLTDEDVKVLAPGEVVTVEIDPNLPEWFVQKDGDGYQSLKRRANDYSTYRIVYAAPTPGELVGLKEANKIVPGDLSARTFSSYEVR